MRTIRLALVALTLALFLAPALHAQEQPPPVVPAYDAGVTATGTDTPVTAADPAPAPGGELGAGEVIEAAGQTIDAYRTGGWLAALAAVVAFLTSLLRRPSLGKLLEHLPKRARILVPLLLGCIAAMLTHAAGGLPWLEAVLVAFLTGPTAVAMHQGVSRSLLGLESPETKARNAG